MDPLLRAATRFAYAKDAERLSQRSMGLKAAPLAFTLNATQAWSVRIRQFVDFSLYSKTISAVAITDALGVEPDRSSVRGSKRDNPPVPVEHLWGLRCDEPGLTGDHQVERVIHRVRPLADRIRELVTSTDVSAQLGIVRYFDAEDGEQENLDDAVCPTGDVLTKLAGQHQLLGWHLEAETLALLASLGAGIDCDEYGD
ncbi:DUF4279 domain-containing protein [Agromyces salentinus]|uniref:DUF4279 domain-containing protein n=1 Tax=Agromyces salentinus TaxID=269421 RepID=UPI0012FAA880|nr:DUF4279 domain-containing protein [Agromyces salentinus]